MAELIIIEEKNEFKYFPEKKDFLDFLIMVCILKPMKK